MVGRESGEIACKPLRTLDCNVTCFFGASMVAVDEEICVLLGATNVDSTCGKYSSILIRFIVLNNQICIWSRPFLELKYGAYVW